jgi:hypothetical protein
MRPVTPFMMIPTLRSSMLAPDQPIGLWAESYHIACAGLTKWKSGFIMAGSEMLKLAGPAK